MKLPRLPMCLASVSALVCLALPTVASANVVSVQNSIYTSLNQSNGSVSLTPFDTSLGTLTGVTIEYAGVTSTQIVNNGVGLGTYTVENSVDPTYVSQAITLTSGSLTVSSSSGNTVSNSPSVAFSFGIPAGSVGQFTTAGTDVIAFDPVGILVDSDGIVHTPSSFDTYLAGTVTEDFTFTPTIVPEPASATLMLGGILAVVSMVSFRRNRLS